MFSCNLVLHYSGSFLFCPWEWTVCGRITYTMFFIVGSSSCYLMVLALGFLRSPDWGGGGSGSGIIIPDILWSNRLDVTLGGKSLNCPISGRSPTLQLACQDLWQSFSCISLQPYRICSNSFIGIADIDDCMTMGCIQSDLTFTLHIDEFTVVKVAPCLHAFRLCA